MRLDRFITLNLVQPLRWGLVPRPSSFVRFLPVLMYHSISDDFETGVHPYYRVCTSPARFREQMQWLKDNGYRGVTLSAGLAALNSDMNSLSARGTGGKGRGEAGGQQTPLDLRPSTFDRRPVVLTFDDGFQDFHTAAWPVLREFGFTATMYLSTAFIGDTRRSFCPADSKLKITNSKLAASRACLTWSEVGELQHAGIEFGSHTVNHPKLVELPWKQIEFEIQHSKLEIEHQLGVSCAAFAYPYAFPQSRRDFVGRLKDLLKASGHQTNVTTLIGRHRPADDTLQIKRLPVNQDDDLPLFAAKLAGAYDWLGGVQNLSKSLRRPPNVSAQTSRSEKMEVYDGSISAGGRTAAPPN